MVSLPVHQPDLGIRGQVWYYLVQRETGQQFPRGRIHRCFRLGEVLHLSHICHLSTQSGSAYICMTPAAGGKAEIVHQCMSSPPQRTGTKRGLRYTNRRIEWSPLPLVPSICNLLQLHYNVNFYLVQLCIAQASARNGHVLSGSYLHPTRRYFPGSYTTGLRPP